jgi:MFS family permease
VSSSSVPDPAPAAANTERPGLWYGWVILAVVFVVLLVLIGTRTSFGVFFKVLSAEFGWNRAQTSGAFSMGMLGYAVSAPFVGWLLDRWSIRWTMSLGVFLFGMGMLIGFFVGALWHLYAMNFILSLGFGMAAHLPQTQVLANWFIKRRGFALGLTSSAQGLAFSTSLATAALIAWLGWRHTYLIFGGISLLLAFPLVALLLRDRPGKMGTVPDAPFLGPDEIAALRAAPDSGAGGPAPRGLFPVNLIFSLKFFFIFILFAAIAYNFTALVVHLVPLATDNGFSPAQGAAIFALFGGMVFAGNLVSGVSDRIGRGRTYVIGAALGAVSCLLLALIVPRAAGAQIIAGAAAAGFGLGLVRPTIAVMLADHFSGPAFGRVNGTMMMLFAATGALGSVATGFFFDLTGRYRESVALMAVFFLISCAPAAALERIKKPDKKPVGKET